ncbi:MAG: hypothetical protein JWM11_1457 [Planctomycetaceae bacterium]|nr:hypothetical protein [Planctomycetaceae bacterium]
MQLIEKCLTASVVGAATAAIQFCIWLWSTQEPAPLSSHLDKLRWHVKGALAILALTTLSLTLPNPRPDDLTGLGLIYGGFILSWLSVVAFCGSVVMRLQPRD